jgi:hypothetical protein
VDSYSLSLSSWYYHNMETHTHTQWIYSINDKY